MKRILITLLVFVLLMQSCAAKDVTVIFNFPEEIQDVEEAVSLPEDANAFHAFVTVANSNSLEMGLTYYEEFDSWFVNGIEGLENSSEQYWHFWVNNEASMVGISSFVPENYDVIELGFADEPRGVEKGALERAVGWLAAAQQESGEIGEHKTWGNAFALIALNLLPGNDGVKQKAADYLLANQKEDAGFAYPGFDSDALHTAAAVIGLIANEQSIESFSKNNATSIDFLLSKQESDAGFSGWGSSDIDTTSWALIALSAARQSLPSKNGKSPVDFLLESQNSDGGFGYQAGQDSAEDYTAEALIAFSASGQEKSREIEDGLDWLKGKQTAEGCLSNVYNTALAAIAFTAYEEDSNSAKACIESMQLPDNGFGRDNETSNAADTGLAAIALSGEVLPTKKQAVDINPEIVPVGSTAKFTVSITNTGKVSARNVSISLQGIPGSWIQQHTSETSIAEIKPGETRHADIYVEMQEAGEMEVFAAVSGEGLSKEENSNMLQFEIGSASLLVSLSMQG